MSSIFQKPPFNYQYLAGIENIVDYRDNTVNIPATYDLVSPANVLARNGQELRIFVTGTIAGAVGAKTFAMTLNGGAPVTLGSFAAADTGAFIIEMRVHRRETSPVALFAAYVMLGGIAASAFRVVRGSLLTLNFQAISTFDFPITLVGDTGSYQYASLSVL